jgi:transcriptional regulator with XRE-family HTH domain
MNQMNGLELGRRVKQLRLQKGMTLKEIESRVGVSATHVSEVERGKTSPTVGALCKIAAALGVNASYLIDFPLGQQVSLTRPDSRPLLTLPGLGVTAEVLTREQPYADITLLMVTLQPDMEKPFIREARPGDKFLHVIDGLVEISVGDRNFLLKRGDSLHFKASQPQHLKNMGEGQCRILWADWPRYTL